MFPDPDHISFLICSSVNTLMRSYIDSINLLFPGKIVSSNYFEKISPNDHDDSHKRKGQKLNV